MKEYSVRNLVETNSFVYQFSAFTTVFSMMSATSGIRLAVYAALHLAACLDVSEVAAVLSPLVGDAGEGRCDQLCFDSSSVSDRLGGTRSVVVGIEFCRRGSEHHWPRCERSSATVDANHRPDLISALESADGPFSIRCQP